MMHRERRWCVQQVATLEELAEKLTNHTWTLCTGFQFGALLFLNDSTSENGAQEYAVVQWCTFDANRVGVQIESITFSWCSFEQALEFLRQLFAGESDSDLCVECYPQIETPEEHGRCHLCA